MNWLGHAASHENLHMRLTYTVPGLCNCHGFSTMLGAGSSRAFNLLAAAGGGWSLWVDDLHETECLGKRYNDSFCIVQKYRISFQKSCILCTLSQKKSSNSAHHCVLTANKHLSFWNQCSLIWCALVPKSSDQMLARALFCVIWQKNSFLLAYLFEQYMYVFQKSLICWQVPMCIGFLFYSLGYVC